MAFIHTAAVSAGSWPRFTTIESSGLALRTSFQTKRHFCIFSVATYWDHLNSLGYQKQLEINQNQLEINQKTVPQTNTSCTLDKWILKFWEIYVAIWTSKFLNVDKYILLVVQNQVYTLYSLYIWTKHSVGSTFEPFFEEMKHNVCVDKISVPASEIWAALSYNLRSAEKQ